MRVLFNRWFCAGLLSSVCMLSASAAESKVYRFDQWKVTITPGRAGAVAARPATKIESPASSPVIPADSGKAPSRLNVRPISLVKDEQDEASPPAPAPSEAVPAHNPNLPPIPLDYPTPLPNGQVVQQGQISPDCCGNQLPVITPRTVDLGASATVVVPQTALYKDIYFSIPFNRAEYNAYPSYRHDATMELLFQQMRQTVIQRGTQNVYQYGMGGYGYGYGNGLNYAYGPGYGYGPGFPQQYYPYNYGLRIHNSR